MPLHTLLRLHRTLSFLAQVLSFSIFLFGVEAGAQSLSLEQASALNKKTMEQYQAKDYVQAIAAGREALVVLERLLASKPAIEDAQTKQARELQVAALFNLALSLVANKQRTNALPLFERYTTEHLEVYGPDDPDSWKAFNDYGEQLELDGRFEKALSAYDVALEGRRRLLGRDHKDTQTTLTNIEDAATALLKEAQAQSDAKAITAIWGRIWKNRAEQLGEKHDKTLLSMHNYGFMLGSIGGFTLASGVLEKVVSLRVETKGENSGEAGDSLQVWAEILQDMERWPQATEVFKRALRSRIAQHGELHQASLVSIGSYGYALAALGRYLEALPFYERALVGRDKVLGPKDRQTIAATSNFGYILDQVGRRSEALIYHERGYRLSRETMGQEHPDTLVSLNNYAQALSELGRYEEAIELGRISVTLRTKVHGPSAAQTLVAKGNLASTYYEADRYLEALPLNEEVLQARVRQLGETHGDSLTALANLGTTFAQLQRHPEALQVAEKAFALRSAKHGATHPDTLESMVQVGVGLRQNSRAKEAVQWLTRAVDILNETWGLINPRTLDAIGHLTTAMRSAGEKQAALPWFEKYIKGSEALRSSASQMGDANQAKYFERYQVGYRNYVRALIEAQQPRQAFDVYEQIRARSLLDQMARHRALDSEALAPEDRARLADYAFQAAQLAQELSTAKPLDQARLRQKRDQILLEQGQFTAKLSQKNIRYRQITSVTLATTQDAPKLIAEDSLFIAFSKLSANDDAATRIIALDAQGQVSWLSGRPFTALAGTIEALRLWSSATRVNAKPVIRDDRGDVVRIIRRQDAGNLEPRWEAVAIRPCEASQNIEPPVKPSVLDEDERDHGLRGARNKTRGAGADCLPKDGKVVESDLEYDELRDYLGAHLFGPVAHLLKGKTKLVLSPDAAYSMIPFDVLRLEGKPLLDMFELSQVQSLSLLKLARERELLGAAPGPDTEEPSKTPRPRARRSILALGNPTYLESGQDIEGTRLRWPALPNTQTEVEQSVQLFQSEGALLITGQQATETRLRQLNQTGELADFRILHFAVHGHFSPSSPGNASLVLRAEGPESVRDGYITLGEWTSMRLNSDLVILSACNTARGDAVGGEGLSGLAYALSIAGNGSTLATLWPVDDLETAEFVTSFLSKLRIGLKPASALAKTKREYAHSAIPKKRSPMFWAPFVLYGI